MPRRHCPVGYGFTLIELLVVVAIIALLIAILLPSLGKVRRRGNTVACITNERALTQTLRMFIQEKGRTLMPGGHAGTYGAWDYQLLGTATQSLNSYNSRNGRGDASDRLRLCPQTTRSTATSSQPGTATTQWYCGTNTARSSGSYGFNTWLFDGPSPTPPGWPPAMAAGDFHKLKAIRNECAVPVFADATVHDLEPRATDGVANLQNPGGNAHTGGMGTVCIDRHGKAVNVAFLDGHVDTVKLGDLWTLKWSANWTRSSPQKIP